MSGWRAKGSHYIRSARSVAAAMRMTTFVMSIARVTEKSVRISQRFALLDFRAR
jgi:hypothetical protein